MRVSVEREPAATRACRGAMTHAGVGERQRKSHDGRGEGLELSHKSADSQESAAAVLPAEGAAGGGRPRLKMDGGLFRPRVERSRR